MSLKELSMPAVIILLILALSLPVAAQETVNINVLAMRMGSLEYIQQQTDEWIDKYEEEHDVKVRVNWDFLEEADIRSQTVQDMAAGTGYYQVIQVGTHHMPLLAENEWIVSLEDYFTEDYKADEIVEASRSTASYEGKMYGAPIYHEATHLVYRHDIFNELGIEPPDTLEEVTEAAKKVTEETDIAGIALRGQRGNGINHVSWKQYLHAFGGEWLENNESPFKPAFNSEKGIRATEWYTNLIQNYAPEGMQTANWRDVMSSFMAGEVAMTIDATSIGRRIVSNEASDVIGKTSFALFPKGPAGRYPWYFSWNLAVSKVGTKEGLEREVVADYALWATSPEMKKRMMLEEGTLPARTSNLESEAAREFYGQEGMSNWLENTIESLQIKEAAENPVVEKMPQWPALGDTVGIQLEKIFAGNVSVEEGLNRAAEIIERDF